MISDNSVFSSLADLDCIQNGEQIIFMETYILLLTVSMLLISTHRPNKMCQKTHGIHTVMSIAGVYYMSYFFHLNILMLHFDNMKYNLHFLEIHIPIFLLIFIYFQCPHSSHFCSLLTNIFFKTRGSIIIIID